MKRIDRTVERYWHWTLELNYEEFETASAEWNQETADRVDAQGPAGIRALTALRQYAHTPLQPYVVANQSTWRRYDARAYTKNSQTAGALIRHLNGCLNSVDGAETDKVFHSQLR